VDLRNPYFGTSAGLATSDFQAIPTASDVAICDSVPIGGWYTCTVKPAFVGLISTGGYTQFRLYFTLDDNDNGAADLLKFYSGNYATVTFRPTLYIDYTP
jgi:hypothetical protein